MTLNHFISNCRRISARLYSIFLYLFSVKDTPPLFAGFLHDTSRAVYTQPMAVIESSKVEALADALKDKRKIWILTGAGISAASGIPTYRNHKGEWQAANPVQHNEFIKHHSARQRYWARSMVGYKVNQRAQPNATHHALTKLQKHEKVSQIVTQNVDRLHSLAGSHNVIDLHGRIDQVICLDCKNTISRDEYQPRLIAINPNLDEYASKVLPDGDAQIDDFDMSQIRIPECESCGGTLMPDVVFFGGTVPKERVNLAYEKLAESDCCLVIGSSLTVFSGFRFPRWANENKIPLFAINQGQMRGEELFDLIVSDESCEVLLPKLVDQLI